MKIDCLNGYFIFKETKVGQVADFMRWSGFSMVKKDDYFTFSALENVPQYSIIATPFLDLPATKTFQGKPWEIFKENGVVYNFLTGTIVPFAAVLNNVKLSTSNNFYMAGGLILPGSILSNGKKILSYSGYFSRDTLSFYYSEVQSV